MHANNANPQDQITVATERDINVIIDLQERWRKDLGRLPRSAHGDHIKRGDTFLVTHNGQEAGYVVAHCGKDGRTNVLQVAVHHELLRSTLGTQLMDHIRRHAIAHNQLSIHLRTRIDLPANLFWPTINYYFAGQARTRTRTRSLLNCWVQTLTAPLYVPAHYLQRRCRPDCSAPTPPPS